MKSFIVYLSACLMCTAFIAVCGAEAISYKDAPNYIDQKKTVEGTIVGTHVSSRSGNMYLNFGDYKKDLSIKIPAENIPKFPADALTLYKGKKVEATGKIVIEEKKLRIYITDPADLKIVGEGEVPAGPEEVAGILTWQEAMNNVGKKVTVEGTVVSVYIRERGPNMLNFDKDWRNSLSVAVFKKENFGDLKAEYEGKKIRVKGKVAEFRDTRQIKVYDPTQIEVIK